MAKTNYSDEALQDLERIGDYISETLKSPIAALNTVNKIQDGIDNLEGFPFIGASLSFLFDIETDYRYLVCGSYLSFYRVEDDVVYIDRILNGRQDYLSILFPNLPPEDVN